MQKRVKRGMALLDVQSPGWREKINLDALDMCSNGVLEQLFKGYHVGLHALKLTYAEAVFYGFDITGEDGDDKENRAKWRRLTDAWKAALH